MQLSLFELRLKTFPLLHPRDHVVFTRNFLKQLPYVNTISQIAGWISRYFETYNVTKNYLRWNRGKIDEGLSCFQNQNGVFMKPAKLRGSELPANLGCIL